MLDNWGVLTSCGHHPQSAQPASDKESQSGQSQIRLMTAWFTKQTAVIRLRTGQKGCKKGAKLTEGLPCLQQNFEAQLGSCQGLSVIGGP